MGKKVEVKPLTEESELMQTVTIDESEATLLGQRMTATNLVAGVKDANKEMLENVPESEVSGCSLYYDVCPIILINGKNTPNRRIFTLMHELVHLTQGTSAICDVDKHNRKESFCNKVASEVLIPHDTIDKKELFYKNGNLNLSKGCL